MREGRKLLQHSNNTCIHPICHSFADETDRCAILQLGDILQFLPELYMLLIILGGDQIRTRLLLLHEILLASAPPMSCIFEQFRLLLVCHAAGLNLVSSYIQAGRGGWDCKVQKFVEGVAPYANIHDFHEARKHFVPFLM